MVDKMCIRDSEGLGRGEQRVAALDAVIVLDSRQQGRNGTPHLACMLGQNRAQVICARGLALGEMCIRDRRRGSSSPSSIYTNPHFSISASSQPLAAQVRTHSSTTADRSLPFLVATP